MQYRPHKLQLTRLSCAALIAVLCPSIGHAQLLPNQAITVETETGSLHVIDDTGAILSTVFAGILAIDVAVSPDGTTGLVTLFTPNQLLRFDLTTSPPTLNAPALGVPLFAEDVDLTCTPTGLALITDGAASNNIVSVDTTTTPMTVVTDLTLPFPAHAVEVSPDGSLAVVASVFADRVQFVGVSPTGILTNLGNLPSVNGPINVDISPNGNIALVPNLFDGTVSVFDLGTLSAAGSINLAPLARLQSVVFAPDGSKAYVYDDDAGTVAVLAIDAFDNVTDTGTRITGLSRALSFFGVDQLAITRNGVNLFVRSAFGFEVVDTSTNTIKTALVAIPRGGSRSGAAEWRRFPAATATTMACSTTRTTARTIRMPVRRTQTQMDWATPATTAPTSPTRLRRMATLTASAMPATTAQQSPISFRRMETETASATSATTAPTSSTRLRRMATETASAMPATSVPASMTTPMQTVMACRTAATSARWTPTTTRMGMGSAATLTTARHSSTRLRRLLCWPTGGLNLGLSRRNGLHWAPRES